MNQKIWIFIVFSLSFSCLQNIAVADPYNKMKHLLALGLEEKGLEVFSEIISDEINTNIHPLATFTIAEYFFTTYYYTNDHFKLTRAFTYYNYYINNFPDSKDFTKAQRRIHFIAGIYNQIGIYGDIFNEYSAELFIVAKKIEFANALVLLEIPNPLEFIKESKEKKNGIETALKYFDDIITNNPMFEKYGYYYKILYLLGYFEKDLVSDGLLETYDGWAEDWGKDITSEKKKIIYKNLSILNKSYPSDELTLNLHLILAKFSMEESSSYDAYHKEVKDHLEYVTSNDLDKNGFRYLLVKEFILKNKFDVLEKNTVQGKNADQEKNAVDSGLMHLCPECGNVVKLEATKCKYCGAELKSKD